MKIPSRPSTASSTPRTIRNMLIPDNAGSKKRERDIKQSFQ